MNVTSTKESVEEYFSQFGELENVYCPTGKGYAFMTFKTAGGIDAVQRARPHKVHYSPPEPGTARPEGNIIQCYLLIYNVSSVP